MSNLRFFIFSFFLVLTISCKTNGIETEPLPSEFQIETSEITDSRDGQKYKIVKIGDQWWMAENLNYYTSTGSWYYDNDSAKYSKPCGRLYLWKTAMSGQASSKKSPSGVKGISPLGWHIPSLSEWTRLDRYLESFDYTGDALKEVGTINWPAPNNGTNKAMFNAVPAGTVYNDGNSFANINYQTTFLTSTIDDNAGGVWGTGLDRDKSNIRYAPLGLQNGWSIRCVKDK